MGGAATRLIRRVNVNAAPRGSVLFVEMDIKD